MKAQLDQARYWPSAAQNQFETTSAEWMGVISDDLPGYEAIRQSLLVQQERSCQSAVGSGAGAGG